MKQNLLAVAAVGLIAGGSAGAVQQAPTQQAQPATMFMLNEKDTLKDVKAVYVWVPDIPELSGRLAASALQTHTELRLREAGIVVPPPPKDVTGLNTPRLEIIATVVKGDGPATGILAYDVNVTLRRPVDLDLIGFQMNPSSPATFSTVHRITRAPVWSHFGVLALVGENNVVAGLRQTVDDEVSAFLNQWLEMNPK